MFSTSHPHPRVSSVECWASSVEHWASTVECQVSSVKCRVSSVEHRASSVKHQASSVECRVLSVEHRASSVKCRVSSIERRELSVECQAFQRQTLSINASGVPRGHRGPSNPSINFAPRESYSSFESCVTTSYMVSLKIVIAIIRHGPEQN
jgi:hypothetical protein